MKLNPHWSQVYWEKIDKTYTKNFCKFVNQHRRDGKREKGMAIAKFFALDANTENEFLCKITCFLAVSLQEKILQKITHN